MELLAQTGQPGASAFDAIGDGLLRLPAFILLVLLALTASGIACATAPHACAVAAIVG